MGLYDREYYREDDHSSGWGANRTMVINLILINVGLFLIDVLVGFSPDANNQGWVAEKLAFRPTDLYQPWMWWRFITAGFVHDWTSMGHILANMFVLFFFGRDLEYHYGRREFLWMYLAAIFVSSLVSAGYYLGVGQPNAICLGASGGISAIVVLFALLFPNRTILFMFIIPMPAWILGVLLIVGNMFGFLQANDNVNYAAHLAGAGFGLLYHFQRLRISPWIPTRHTVGQYFRSKPKLSVHHPELEEDDNEEVDRILQKISEKGEASLTAKERKTLEDASRKRRERQGRA
ncbi:Rhomboid family intramembrane serine protease [Planctomycetales bacterium 10988]|nr:Rhomboid family intramembrane serine protease [Planctomycetales bacterium 10988]